MIKNSHSENLYRDFRVPYHLSGRAIALVCGLIITTALYSPLKAQNAPTQPTTNLIEILSTGSVAENTQKVHPRTHQMRETRRNLDDLSNQTSALPRPAVSLPVSLNAVVPMLDVDHQGEPVTLLRVVATPSNQPVTAPIPHVPLNYGVPLPDAAPVDLTLDPSQIKPLEGIAAVLYERIPASDWSRVRRLKAAQRDSLITFYAERRYAPVWIENNTWNKQAQSIFKTFAKADLDALNISDYTVSLINQLPSAGKELAVEKERERFQALADADLRLSALVLMYANDARGGRLEPSRISAMMTPTLELPKASELFAHLFKNSDAGLALASYHPQHEGYRRLKQALANLRNNSPTLPTVKIPHGPIVRVGMTDERVALIRSRFGLVDSSQNERTHVYDQQVAFAVSTFQKQSGLPANGLLTRATIEALGGNSLSRQESDLIATMERWRWLPADLGTRHIFVNIPEYTLRVFVQNKMTHQARVIVGKTETPTPIFSDKMEHLIVNPSWYVPPSILQKEFLPKLATDPDYATRRGFEVLRNKTGQAVGVRQPPGERNALGNIKFIFPNNHAVYLHDTPNRNLFASQTRAFSHGCVRVDKPFELAQEIMGGVQVGWSEKRLRAMIGSGERHIKVTPNLPVHLAYFTIQADENGSITRFDDLYGYHRRVREALERLSTL